MFKSIVSMLIAVGVALLAIYVLFWALSVTFKLVIWLVFVAAVALISLPIYYYIKNKLLR